MSETKSVSSFQIDRTTDVLAYGDTSVKPVGRKVLTLSTALEELHERWSHGDRPLSDDYFSQIANLSAEDAIDLIYCEFQLRKQYQLFSSPDAFYARFPQHREALERQFLFEDAFEMGTTASFIAPAPQPHPVLGAREYPTQLGRYLVVAPLGSGGQADVFLAVHPTLLKNVVVKLGRHRISDSSQNVELIKEGRLLATLKNPNLVSIYDIEIIDGYPMVVMEYIPGQSLDQYASFRHVGALQAAKIVISIARAIEVVHRQNVLHLDLKPKNIVIDERDEPRVIDFGLSRLIQAWTDLPRDDGISGSLQYMAPEQANDSAGKVGPTTDIFALGGILYFLLTGKPPYSASNVKQQVKLISEADWDKSALRNLTLPGTLVAICERAMALKPEERFQTAEEFANSLESFTSQKSSRRSSIPWLIAGAAGCLLAVVSAVVLTGRSGASTAKNDAPVIPSALTVTVWNHGHFQPIADRLPMVNGDELKMTFQIAAGQSAVLLHFDNESQWTILKSWPAQKQKWEATYPETNQTVPLSGIPSIQVLAMITAPNANELTRSLQQEQFQLKPLPSISPYSLIHFNESGTEVIQGARGLGAPIFREQAENVVVKELASLQSFADRHGGTAAGVAFFKR